VKLYSYLSLLRTDRNQRGVIDERVSEAGLGPSVLSNTDEGIAHSFLQGRVLEEVIQALTLDPKSLKPKPSPPALGFLNPSPKTSNTENPLG
jgi:hypothetical protein